MASFYEPWTANPNSTDYPASRSGTPAHTASSAGLVLRDVFAEHRAPSQGFKSCKRRLVNTNVSDILL